MANKTIPLILFALCVIPCVYSFPLTYDIEKHSNECLWEKLEEDEYVTMAVFVSHGSPLMARADIEGPVARVEDDHVKDILESMGRYYAGARYGVDMRFRENRKGVDKTGTIRMQEKVDYENIDYNVHYDVDEDSEYVDPSNVIADDDRMQKMERKKEMMYRRRREIKLQAKRMSEGDPWQKTIQVMSPGWYKFCVFAIWSEVSVEFDVRKSSEFAEPDDSGHIPFEIKSHEVQKELVHQGADEQDIAQARQHIDSIGGVIKDLQKLNREEKHRVQLHHELNQHSHSTFVMNEILETIVFIVITGFQLYTVRKWFKDNTILGR